MKTPLTCRLAVAIGILAFPCFILVFNQKHGISQLAIYEKNETRCPVNSPTNFLNGLSGSGATGSVFKGLKVRNFPSDSLRFVRREDNAWTSSSPSWPISLKVPQTCQYWAVCTTIQAATSAVWSLLKLGPVWCLVIVADKKTPKDFFEGPAPENSVFLSVHDQETLAGEIPYVATLPWNHFGRKNLGYLFAVWQKARIVFDFDDDNELKQMFSLTLYPEDKMFDTVALGTETLGDFKRGWVFNPYPLMGSSNEAAWPRGFPMTQITNEAAYAWERTASEVSRDNIKVFQSLADKDPDVDAVYRLTQRQLHFTFSASSSPIALPHMVFSPYNAQASVHLPEAFWGLLLPISVTGRVSDIWRSYITQRLLWECGFHIAFVAPIVTQDRNAHNYLADMSAEVDLYFKADALVEFLSAWNASHLPSLPAKMEQLYVDMYERGYIELPDVVAAQEWLSALVDHGYTFPTCRDADKTMKPPARVRKGKKKSSKSKGVTQLRGSTDVTTTTPSSASSTSKQEAASHNNSLPATTSTRPLASTTCKSANVSLPTVAMVVRTYFGHEGMLHRMLANLGMFVPDFVERVVILDSESKKDHRVGDALQEKFPGLLIYYEDFPKFDLRPANQGMARAKTVGYNRMLWSSFYCETYTQADIIGVMDTDMQIINLIRPDLIVNSDGKMFARMVGHDMWPADLTIVGVDQNQNLDAMFLDHLPMFYWRSTFMGIREHLQRKWMKSTFDEAFEAFQHMQFSPQNMLYQYGLAFEPDKYELLKVLSLDRAHVPKGLGLNKAPDDRRLVASCCLTYHLSPTICPARKVLHQETINGFDYKPGHEYLDCLRKEFSSAMVDAMMNRCLVEVTAKTWKARGDALGDSEGNLAAPKEVPKPTQPTEPFQPRRSSTRMSTSSIPRLHSKKHRVGPAQHSSVFKETTATKKQDSQLFGKVGIGV